MSYATTQFPGFIFCGLHIKLNGVRGLSKNHHIILDSKLGNGKCEIHHITFACVACHKILDMP